MKGAEARRYRKRYVIAITGVSAWVGRKNASVGRGEGKGTKRIPPQLPLSARLPGGGGRGEGVM